MIAAIILAGVSFSSCDDDNVSNLRLDGSTEIESFKLGGYSGEIDYAAKTIFVGVPVDCDLTDIVVSEISLGQGASADIVVGEHINCSVPRTITVSNGDVFTKWTLTAKHDDVQFLTAMLDGQYSGTIDNAERTIMFFVPLTADVTAMTISYTLNEGATAVPESGSTIDFTNPVKITASYRTATIDYTVTVIKDEMSQEPKAFVGNADNIESLGAEAKAAAQWMIANVPNVE